MIIITITTRPYYYYYHCSASSLHSAPTGSPSAQAPVCGPAKVSAAQRAHWSALFMPASRPLDHSLGGLFELATTRTLNGPKERHGRPAARVLTGRAQLSQLGRFLARFRPKLAATLSRAKTMRTLSQRNSPCPKQQVCLGCARSAAGSGTGPARWCYFVGVVCECAWPICSSCQLIRLVHNGRKWSGVDDLGSWPS